MDMLLSLSEAGFARREKRMLGHVGTVLLRRCVDRTGLTGAPARVLVHLAVAIVLGAAYLSCSVFWASDSAARRTPATSAGALAKIAEARRRVLSLLYLRPGGFPRLTVAGTRLTGWIAPGRHCRESSQPIATVPHVAYTTPSQ